MAQRVASRRQVLRAASLAGVVGLAGCGGDGGDGGADGVTGDDYPTIDEWLTETDLGGADDTYDGSFVDQRDSDSVTVDVGAEGNGGAFAYGPSALVVSTGTEVQWNWTGEGNPHNVEALPEEQLGESDYEFSSGEPEGGSGVKYTRTLGEAGIVLYHCEPHFSLGMKGGIAVE
ncbi:halocyanin domain-containing protein [Halomicroarcula sp. F13]|uniref:Halocyanin domain-containing protein n=1 Tax=Haloarcula rubra TaxID=2487747 RepID=A0AAW4PST6_9EURY|nr:halocyanin domain-containing protein [Halomicroarcula rubra]MBX0324199.1 halocyanin domain-containing protein [Halomicroarcula rubra]